jgi:molybdopterin converting factor small subunit
LPLKVLLAANLRKYVPNYDSATGHTAEIHPGSSVRTLAAQLAIPIEEVKLILVDGRSAAWDTLLQGDERVAFFPPVGGG